MNLSHLAPRLGREGLVLEQHVREGRFQRGLALIAALSGALSAFEVALEHVRGSYGQRVMYAPLVSGPLLTLAGVWAVFSRRAARTWLPLVSLGNVVVAAVGFAFHIRGVRRKPGGWRVPLVNVPMGPPLFAPLLFGIGGFLGLIAAPLRREDDPVPAPPPGLWLRARAMRPAARPWWLRRLPPGLAREAITLDQDAREGRFQQLLAGATALFAVFNGFEALYSHYKNNFYNRVEWTPILLTPVLIVAGLAAIWSRAVARTLLPLSALASLVVGGIGMFFHARGLVLRPGGLHEPRYNLVYGPPLFAPLLFAATGFLGLLAGLMRRAK